MRRETKVSIAILLFGFLAIAISWFTNQQKAYVMEEERIVLLKSEPKEVPKAVKAYLEDLKQHNYMLPLEKSELDNKAQKVQTFLLANRAFLKDTRSPQGKALHNDMMTIRPVITSVLNNINKEICESNACYEAIKYNFVTNTTTRAIVSVENLQLLDLKYFRDMQPDISLRHKKIAQEIALNAPEISEELGEAPSIKEMSMANVRGSLNSSPCENKQHLCVAPTFSYHDKEEALWAIVNLTELKLVAAKWAGLGKTTTPACISERSLQNREMMEKYCRKDTFYREGKWELSYRMTGSDGLEVINARYEGKPVVKSAKIVDWHVAYEGKGRVNNRGTNILAGREVEFVQNEDKYLFGYNDAMGCPMFSTSVVLPFNAPRILPLIQDGQKKGFYLVQDFRNPKWPMACNYRYENRFEFYDDGSFQIVGVNIGRGCGEKAIYRPVMRVDMDLKAESLSQNGQLWQREQKHLIGEGEYQLKGSDTQAYSLEFHDAKSANLFVTQFYEEEGHLDLLTLGSCCKLEEDGVERYVNDENIVSKDLVLWYVPTISSNSKEGQESCWADTRLEQGRLVVKEFPCSVGFKLSPMR